VNLIEVDTLAYTYPGTANPAIELENLSLENNRIHGLLGPNGSGKSTFFKILSTQVVDFKGSVSILGHELNGKDSKLLRSQIGVTFQSPSLDPLLTVLENLKIHGALYDLKGAELEKRIDQVLDLFELQSRKHERTETLSGGLSRRVELAKSLLNRPKLLLLDEPTTGVDPHLRLRFWQELRKLVENENVSLLVSTHLMEEAELCDSLVILNEGHVVDQGSPETLKSRFGHDVIEIRIDAVKERSELESLAKSLLALLPSGAKAAPRGDLLRIEVSRGLSIMPMIESHFGSKLVSMQWGKPTLEDVFLAKTGKSLQS
jgi:ABC-2 type transport system ATP-binding protein